MVDEDSEGEIIAGTSAGTRSVWVLTSPDGGVTWSEPRDITPSAKRESWTWYATGPGIGIQTRHGASKGRLVIPCDHIEAGTKRHFSHMLLSDDHGMTWRLGGTSPRDELNECQVAELSDGRLVVNMRSYDRARKMRAVMHSTDGGESFGPVTAVPELPDPICQAGLLGVGLGGGAASRATGGPGGGPSLLFQLRQRDGPDAHDASRQR